ncbi:MAG: type II toxin-antitoxin system RelE/ParE family toxin, partial [bacterium]|nr:type II toxin-antitoxin system RelE/ParE family toxin [bacterium]
SSLGMPHAKRLSSVLFELRIRGRQEIRILYCLRKRSIYLLHGFKKQTQKTPQKEIETALKRFQTLTDV